jgi:hypothetical protein
LGVAGFILNVQKAYSWFASDRNKELGRVFAYAKCTVMAGI